MEISITNAEGEEFVIVPLQTYDTLREELNTAKAKIETFAKLNNNNLDAEWFWNHNMNILTFKIMLNGILQDIQIPLQHKMPDEDVSLKLFDALSKKVSEFIFKNVFSEEETWELSKLLSNNKVKEELNK